MIRVWLLDIYIYCIIVDYVLVLDLIKIYKYNFKAQHSTGVIPYT